MRRTAMLLTAALAGISLYVHAQNSAGTGNPRLETASAVAPTVPADQTRQRVYSHGRYVLYFANQLCEWAVLLIVLTTGLSARFRDWAERVTGRPSGVVLAYFFFFLLFAAALTLPLELYGGYFRERRFGFAHQTLPQWMGDWAKFVAVSFALGGLFLVALHAVIRKFPRGWWAGAVVVATTFMILSMAIAPVFIAPLFNKFTPLPDSPLKRRLLEMAHAQGIPANNVYQVDASRQSRHTNAYVAGLLGTERIVLYDTILATDTPDEIEAVIGHEMGHYVLHHIWKMITVLCVLIFLAGWLIEKLSGTIAARYGSRWGFREIGDVAGLPLILLLFAVFQFLATPAINAVSRSEEREADAFSLKLTRKPNALVSDFVKFNVMDLAEYDPPRFIEFWLYTHPSLKHRIEFCEMWKRAHERQVPGPRPAGT